MVVSDAIHNIMGGMESTAGVRLHNHRRKLKQRFDIIKKLGQGTYGKVQLGINKETGQEVAIKTIKKSKIETDADLVRIRREIQIMSSVQHPNIIHIYEVFENREKMVLVMEYAAGGELYDYLSERKVLDEAEARRIFRQISTAVYYCHKHKICHRDLKLENILLDEHGSAKIADFGLSNVFDEQRLLGTFCGSPLYASPEIVKGTPYHGPEVDCWSLGVLLYTLVYGAMPFDGSNFKRLVKQISQGDYFEPKKPSPASSLIRDMLNVNPACRANIEKICSHWWVNESYAQSCAEIAEELANQTPVRLDLLLSLAPAPASAEALLVNKDQDAAATVVGPARSQSVGSLMELDHPRVSFDAEKRRLSEAGAAAKDSPPKRKLEQGPSTEEANQSGAKRKERSRHRDREHSSERRQHRSTSRSKGERQSSSKKPPTPDPSQVPLPDEARALENASVVSEKAAESMDVDVDVLAAAKDAEEAAKKAGEAQHTEVPEDAGKRVAEGVSKAAEVAGEEAKPGDEAKKVKVKRKKKTSDLKLSDSKEEGAKVEETVAPKSEDVSEVKNSSQKEEAASKDEPVPKVAEATADAATEGDKPKEVPQETQEVKPEANGEAKEKKVVKKVMVKKKSDLSASKIAQAAGDKPAPTEEATAPAKPMVRRRSKIFESEIQKFNNMSASTSDMKPAVEKPKKVFIPGVKVSDFKKAYERKSSVELVAPPLVPGVAKAPVKKAVTDKEGANGEAAQPADNEANATTAAPDLVKEKAESSGKVENVAHVDEKILKPEESSIQNSTEKAIEKEKADDVTTTKESQKAVSDKVETAPAVVNKEEVKQETSPEKPPVKDDLVKRQKAVAIIGNAISKPPKPALDKLKPRAAAGVRSPPESPKKVVAGDEAAAGKKMMKVQVGPNDVRNATLQVSTPEQIKNFTYNEAAKTEADTEDVAPAKGVEEKEVEKPAEGKKSSKVEIVLKSATLPRRKTSKAEIQLGTPKAVDRPAEYRTEVEHMVGTPNNKLQNQRSEVAFPVAAAAQPTRSVSVEPEGAPKAKPKERIIPIQFERSPEERPAVPSPPPSKPPVPPLAQQRSLSQRSSSLSRQSTLESDTESTGGAAPAGPEPIRKSPREFIIPIAVEGGGYITPRAGSLEPESTSESTTSAPAHKPRKPHRFPRTMRMGSLLSDGGLSEDEGFNSISSPFGTLNRHREQREGEADEERGLHHMHRLRSSRPTRRPTVERAESLSSGEEEEDDDDGFELLTAESLFSTLLSRVRNLTQRLNVDDTRHGFPTSRFMNMNHNFPSHSPFWSNMEPMSRRVSETSQFSRPSRDESGSSWRRSASRDTDCDSQYSDATNSNAAGSSLPRGSSRHDFDDISEGSTSSYPSYYTPSLARRIQRTNLELRNRSSSNLDSSYGSLPPRDYTTLPARRPMSRTSSFKSTEEGLRRPTAHHFLPTRSPSCLDSSRKTDKIRSFERSGSVERYLPQVGNGDGGHSRGGGAAPVLSSNNGPIHRELPPTRRSASYLGARGCLGSSDSLNYVGYSRDRGNRNADIDSHATKSFLPPTRRNITSLDNGYVDSLPRRRTYRSSMSDSVDTARKKSEDYHRSHSQIAEETNSYNHETLPPLPQSSNYGRKREGGVQKSSSYLRQRALDIANIYGGPLQSAEPTPPLGRDSDSTSVGRSSLEDRITGRYGEGEQRGRSQIPKVSRFRSSSLNRENDQLHGESIRETILRRQKSYDKLDQNQDRTQNSRLQRPLSLSIQQPTESSVLSKFLSGSGNEDGLENNGMSTLNAGENQTSPVRSPGRKVSRFLRPDFYDTPREESTFAKEKEEALKNSKEVEEPKEQREPEQFYKDLSEKLASKLQILSEMGLAKSESQSENPAMDKKQEPDEQNSNKTQLDGSNENNLIDINKSNGQGMANNNTVSSQSEELVLVEPKVAKVFNPKVIKKEGISVSPKPFENTVSIQEATVTKDGKTKSTKEPSKPVEDFVKAQEPITVLKDPEAKLITKDPTIVKPKSSIKDGVAAPTPPKVSTSPVPKVSNSPLPKVLTSPVLKVSTSPVPKVSTSPVPKVSTSPVPKVSTPPVPKVSTSPVPKVSTSPVPKVSTPSVPKVSTPPVPKVSTSPVPKVSTSPVPKVSTSPVPKVTTSPVPKVSTSPVPKVSTSPVPKMLTSPVPKVPVSPVPKDSKEVVSKIPMPKEAPTNTSKDGDVDFVSANTVLNGPSSAQEAVMNATQNSEEKVTKSAEGTPKVKVKRKIKKPLGTESAVKPVDVVATKIDSLEKTAAPVVNHVDAVVSADDSKTDKNMKLDAGCNNDSSAEREVAKASGGVSRIERMIRTLRERSLTPKGTEDMLTVSNLLKRAVSVDNCSAEPSAPKSTNKIKKVIRSLKELTSSPKANIDTESNLLKRAVSVDDCSSPVQAKSKVSSVLGIFRKMEEPKAEAKAEKKASLLSRFRKTQSLYVGAASDSVLVPCVDSENEREKPSSTSARRFGFRGSKGNRISSSFEIESTVDGDNSYSGGVCNGVGNGNSDANVSCSVKIKLPEKETLNYSKQNGLPMENDKDVSISTTIKLIKDVTKENAPKAKQVNQDGNDALAKKKTSNIPRACVENGIANGGPRPGNCYSRLPARMTAGVGPTCDVSATGMDERTGAPDGGPCAPLGTDPTNRRTGRSKDTDPRSSPSEEEDEEEDESIDDTSSVCSDWESRTSPLPAYQHRAVVPDLDELESMQERIRRKSFFSRFNDAKKKPVAFRRTSTSAIPLLRETEPAQRDNRPDEI